MAIVEIVKTTELDAEYSQVYTEDSIAEDYYTYWGHSPVISSADNTSEIVLNRFITEAEDFDQD